MIKRTCGLLFLLPMLLACGKQSQGTGAAVGVATNSSSPTGGSLTGATPTPTPGGATNVPVTTPTPTPTPTATPVAKAGNGNAAPAPQPNSPAAVAVFRLYQPFNGDHLYSRSMGEAASAGYRVEGVAFGLFASAQSGLAPLYRCWYAPGGVADHFASLDANCEGQKIDGPMGFIAIDGRSGTSPLLRCVKGGRHLITKSSAECANAGFAVEGALGGSPDVSVSVPSPGKMAIFRLYQGSTGDHLYSTSQSEGAGAGYGLEGQAFTLFNAAAPGMVPVFRCWVALSNSADHFISLSPSCEGQHVDGLLGFTKASGSTPLYRCYNGSRHLNTLSTGECAAAGYGVEGALGFTN